MYGTQSDIPLASVRPDPRGRLRLLRPALIAAAVVLLAAVVVVRWLAIESEDIRSMTDLLEKSHQEYLAKEGPARRGPLFEQVGLRLQVLHLHDRPVTLDEIIKYCGPPDRYFGPRSSPRRIAFFYDRFGKKDWALLFDLDTTGSLSQIGWMPPSKMNFAGWGSYSTSTQSAEDKPAATDTREDKW